MAYIHQTMSDMAHYVQGKRKKHRYGPLYMHLNCIPKSHSLLAPHLLTGHV